MAIDFSRFQQEIDACFHTREDAYPAGAAEHSELLTFIQKLHRLKTSTKFVLPMHPSCTRA